MLRTRRIRAPKRLVRVRLHEPLANCARFQPSHLIQVLESPAVNTVAVGYSPHTSRARPTLSLTSTTISLRSAPEDSWLGDQGGQPQQSLGPKTFQTHANWPLLQIPAQSLKFNDPPTPVHRFARRYVLFKMTFHSAQ